MCLLHLHHLHMCCRACVHLINAHIEDLRPCDKRPSMNPLLLAWSQCGSRNKSHRNPESKFKIGWERSWSPLVHLFLLLFRGGWGGVQTWRLHLLLKVGWTAKWGTWLLGWHHISFHMYVILSYVGSPYILGPRSICFRFVICFQWLRPQQRTRSSWGSTWYEDCWPFAIIRCKELIIVMAFFPHTIEISSNKTSFSPSFNFLHIISCDFCSKTATWYPTKGTGSHRPWPRRSAAKPGGEPTHLKHMQLSKWVKIFPQMIRGEHTQKYSKFHSPPTQHFWIHILENHNNPWGPTPNDYPIQSVPSYVVTGATDGYMDSSTTKTVQL